MADDLNIDSWRQTCAEQAAYWDDGTYGLNAKMVAAESVSIIERARELGFAITVESLWFLYIGCSVGSDAWRGPHAPLLDPSSDPAIVVTAALASALFRGEIAPLDTPIVVPDLLDEGLEADLRSALGPVIGYGDEATDLVTDILAVITPLLHRSTE